MTTTFYRKIEDGKVFETGLTRDDIIHRHPNKAWPEESQGFSRVILPHGYEVDESFVEPVPVVKTIPEPVAEPVPVVKTIPEPVAEPVPVVKTIPEPVAEPVPEMVYSPLTSSNLPDEHTF